MKSLTLSFFAVLSLSLFAGCAANSESADEGVEEGSDNLTARQLPDVATVEIAEVQQTRVLSSKTLGAPKKVKDVVTAIKKLRPTDSVPRCFEQKTTRITFFNATNKKVATVDTHCAGYGSISFADGSEGYGVKFAPDSVGAAASAPYAVGDALWGITQIELNKIGQPSRVIDGEAMTPILKGIDLDQIPDPTISMPRCRPNFTITFKRADASVAYTSFMCGTSLADAPASLKAQFSAPGATESADPLAHGGITLDPRPILHALQ